MPNQDKQISAFPLRNPDVLAQGATSDTMLFDMVTGQYYALNGIGGLVWELSDGAHAPEEIATLIRSEYDASFSTILEDVQSLILELSSNGLLSLQAG